MVVRRQYVQVSQAQATPRGTQDRQPVHPVSQVVQGMRQRQQVLNGLATSQPFDLHRLEKQARMMTPDLGHQRLQMGTCPHQHSDLARGIGLLLTQNQRHDGLCFPHVSLCSSFFPRQQGMHFDPSFWQRGAARHERPVANRPLRTIVFDRKHAFESLVDPRHHLGAGAVVQAQAQAGERQVIDTLLGHLKKQADIRLAETINRLHRIAHAKQRAPVFRRPALRELPQQFDLRRAGVLKLIHQQVLDTVVQFQRQIGRRPGGILERGQCACRHLDEIDLPRFLEHHPQLGCRQVEQLREHTDDFPLGIAVSRQGQLADAGDSRLCPGGLAQRFDDLRQAFLVGFSFVHGRQTHGLVETATQGAAAGQQQVAHAAPHWQGFRLHRQRLFPIQEQCNRMVARQVRSSVAGHRHELGLQPAIEHTGDLRHLVRHQFAQGLFCLVLQAMAMGMLQPLVTLGQHADQQARQAAMVVVQIAQGSRHDGGSRVVLLQQRQRAPHRLLVVQAGILRHCRLRAKARHQWHLAGEMATQGIDGIDPQAPRLFKQMPAQLGRNGQRFGRQRKGHLLVRFGWLLALRPYAQTFQNTQAHFRGGFVGEGDRDDLFRLTHGLQQAQIALGQQFGLAGTRGRLDDERLQRQRAFTIARVFQREFLGGSGHKV